MILVALTVSLDVGVPVLGEPQGRIFADPSSCFRPGAASSRRATSSWLSTTGARRGLFTVVRGRTRSGRSSVTAKKKRNAAMAALMDPALICCFAIPNVVPLGVLIETARRHVVDHALAQRADGLVEHRESSCLAWGSKPHDLETERRLALPRPPTPHADARRPPRERFSPSTFSGHCGSRRWTSKLVGKGPLKGPALRNHPGNQNTSTSSILLNGR